MKTTHPILNLPTVELKYKMQAKNLHVYDRWRKKYILLTPEEWVRQHFVNYLTVEKKFPESLLVLEQSLKVNRLQKRSDIVVYNNKAEPILIVECKAPEVKISQATFDQIVRYNSILLAKYLVVTNGLQHYCCKINYDTNDYTFLENVPVYKEL